ncbi:MAG: magnesium chelatase [Planctomycetota bacterium]|nr:magnesium chelatase [Planctomycetota bacterium]
MKKPQTLGELKKSKYRSRTVKEELRQNLIGRLRENRPLFEGVVGYEKTVIPQVVNAILSGHDFILLGLRGQAKTRILRSLTELLDEEIPAVTGSEIRDDPLRPIEQRTFALIAKLGDELPITWIPRAERYHEKLATPDVTIADLIGDIDPIKAATRKLTFADPEVVHYGIIPRSNRGIFAINELPDLSARIQVGLLNILEEGDIQIRGFPVRLALDIELVFSANPEDYTNRGSIITPLRDRISSQILTHYPRTIEDAMKITAQESWVARASPVKVDVPDYLRMTIEEVAFQARASEFVDQNSGVSARVTIALLENTVSNAERRAFSHGEEQTTARISDVFAASSSITGKIELVYEGEREGVQSVARALIGKAAKAVFDRHFPDAYALGDAPGAGEGEFKPVVAHFQNGRTLDLSDEMTDAELVKRLSGVPSLEAIARKYLSAASASELAAAMEFVLEGLHQGSLLAKNEMIGGRSYRDMFEDMVKGLKKPTDKPKPPRTKGG